MWMLLAIAVGGALGAIARYGIANLASSWWGTAFPYGTMIANVSGCLIIGLFYSWYQDRMISPEVRAFVQVGLLGALTTFSTFSLESLRLMEQGEVLRAGLNVLLSVVVCLLATAFGMLLGRQI